MEGPLGWVRREAGRALADDPQTTTIRRTVGWASLAGAILGVVLAFVASEPEDAGRAMPAGRSAPPITRARPPSDRPPSPHARASALPPVGTPTPPSLDGVPAAPAVAPAPAVALSPAAPSPPRGEAHPDTPSAGADGSSQVQVGASTTPAAASAKRGIASRVRPHENQGLPSPRPKAVATGADADELVWLAERAFQAGHAAEAVRLGQKALAAGAGARAQLTIAGAYFDMRDFDHARSAYEAVLAEEPGNQAARTGLDISRSALTRSIARAP